jgi:hypothetical protein
LSGLSCRHSTTARSIQMTCSVSRSSAIMGKYAIGDARSDSRGIRLSLMVHAIRMVLGWRLRGQGWPNPFYERGTRAPIYPVGVLSRQQREALRRFCGPHPTARADGDIAH